MPYVQQCAVMCLKYAVFCVVFFSWFYIAESNIQRSQQRSSEVTQDKMFLNAFMMSVFKEQKQKRQIRAKKQSIYLR